MVSLPDTGSLTASYSVSEALGGEARVEPLSREEPVF
jgi:hypothetical protein